jgi:CheY-like chemotaxis protein
MRTLLIHNDNLNENLIKCFDEEALLFNISNQALLNPNFSFDKEAHEQLKDHFEEFGKFDLIALPYNLSPDNYLEFSGIQLANHIRLTKEWQHHKTPILFLGEETPTQIARLMRSDILFTKGVFCSRNQSFEEIAFWAKKLKDVNFEISENEYGEIINRLVLAPPNDYDSHHNLDNDFSLYLWSKAIGLELLSLKREIESGLFFKWWSIKNEIVIDQSPDLINESSNSKKDSREKRILLIDDQHEKGWYMFFKKLLPTVEVHVLVGNYKKPEQFFGDKNIIDSAIAKITNFDPHLILLDLRLTDSDNEKDKSQLTGIKILNAIQKNETINQGIQFISLSASDKIWNYKELLKKKISSFIVKNTDFKDTLGQTISEHRKLIYRKIEEANYLKEIYNKLSNLKTLLKESIEIEEFELQKVQLDLVYELVVNGISQPKYNNFAFHLLFQVMEGFAKSKNIFEQIENEAYVICKGLEVLVRKEYSLDDNQKVVKELCNVKGKIDVRQRLLGKNTRYLDTNFIIVSILHIRFGLADSNSKFNDWNSFNDKRNKKTGHGSNEKVSTIKCKDLKGFIEFLSFLFDQKNQKETNVKRYLTKFNFHSDTFNRPSVNTIGDFMKKNEK